jgi:ABC-type multidrug transport system, ATPase component
VIIKVEDLVKRYGDLLALDHFSIEVKDGEIFGLLGPSGAGKSTVVQCILSVLKYDKGSVKIFGHNMAPNSFNIKRDIGVVMQDIAVFEELTVYENIDYFCGLYIKEEEIRKALVWEALDFIGLKEVSNTSAARLNTSMLRRLHIACGIAHKPRLLILDEPLITLDTQTRNHILAGLLKRKEQGATIFYVSNRPEELETFCSQIAIMDKGKMIAIGSSQQLKELIGTGEKIQIQVSNMDMQILTILRENETTDYVNYTGKSLIIRSKKEVKNLSYVISLLEEYQVLYGNITLTNPTLYEVFYEMTGRELKEHV